MNRSKSFGDGQIDLHEDLKDALFKINQLKEENEKLNHNSVEEAILINKLTSEKSELEEQLKSYKFLRENYEKSINYISNLEEKNQDLKAKIEEKVSYFQHLCNNLKTTCLLYFKSEIQKIKKIQKRTFTH
jgi:hypothetical protein